MPTALPGPQLHREPYPKPTLWGTAASPEPEQARLGAGMVPRGDGSRGRAAWFSCLEPLVFQHPGGAPAKPHHFPLQPQRLTRLL